MNYKVHDSKRGKVFATLEEANAYRNEIIHKTGYVYAISETKAAVTYVYNLESK